MLPTLTQAMRASGLPPLEARALLSHILQVVPAWIVAHSDTVLNENAVHRFAEAAARRRSGEPVAYIVGEKEFWGLDFCVTPDVLIPRPDTETLVEAALRFLPEDEEADVLDLGTGSGAVAIALAHERPRARFWAVDASAAALDIARLNARRLLGADAVRLRWLLSDWFAALPLDTYVEKFSAITGNPPYIAADDAHLAVGDLRFEPRAALTSGVSGLEALQAIIQRAPPYLRRGGALLLEHGYDQSEAVTASMRGVGLVRIDIVCDLAGIGRVTLGIRDGE